MKIRFAESRDRDMLIRYDKHIKADELKDILSRKRILTAEENGQFAGWLRYGMFWDSIPFMNMLYILEEFRGKGAGRQMVMFWENEMKRRGYQTLMTSAQSDEYAQHFYFRLGYEAVGGFRMGAEPYEVIFAKTSADQNM